jgi:SAM-dependent methyltransferase
MNLTEEYRMQASWRDWDSYIKCLPLDPGDTVLDLGCSLGFVSKLLAEKVSHVIALDLNSELLDEARLINNAPNISYKKADLRNIDLIEIPQCNGIWTSFVPAYFPEFSPVLKNWLSFLKPGGWIAIVEMGGLYNHVPLSEFSKKIFKDYYIRQRLNNGYDFEMGYQLKNFILESGLTIIHEEDKFDRELSFVGPAEQTIFKAWEARFERMHVFREYLGEDYYRAVRNDFLNCIRCRDHSSNTTVKFIIAKK